MGCKCRTTTIVVAPQCPTGCIRGGYHIINGPTAPGPCGDEFDFDLADIEVNAQNLTTCAASLRYTLEDWDKTGFEIVTRSGSVISGVTTQAAKEGKIYKIRYGVYCDAKGLSDSGEVWVVIRDLCATVDCSSSQVCGRCTGTCTTAEVDISSGNCLNC